MKIEHSNNEHKGFFKAVEEDTAAGKMTYAWAGSNKIIIDHTEVNPDFKGKGIGNQMLMAAVDYARKNKLKIVPLCPFAKSVFDKTEDIRDVL